MGPYGAHHAPKTHLVWRSYGYLDSNPSSAGMQVNFQTESINGCGKCDINLFDLKSSEVTQLKWGQVAGVSDIILRGPILELTTLLKQIIGLQRMGTSYSNFDRIPLYPQLAVWIVIRARKKLALKLVLVSYMLSLCFNGIISVFLYRLQLHRPRFCSMGPYGAHHAPKTR